MVDPTFFDKYGAALGFSAIFLMMLYVLWTKYIADMAAWQVRYDAMLEDQQTRYDKLVADDQIRYDKLQEKYLVDLAGGTAMNVRYTRQYQFEDDTQTRRGSKAVVPNLSDDEYVQGIKRMSE